MKYTKKELDEIVNADGELIGDDDMPTNGSDLATAANNTTDYNTQVSHQPYRYDMLGRFGFTMLPFFEGKEDQGPDSLLDDLAGYFYEEYKKMLEHYYRNPNKLKQDFRKKQNLDFETDGSNEHSFRKAEEVLKIVKPHFEKSLKELDETLKENINESSFVEGKMLDKKDDKDVVEKGEPKELSDDNLSKIAGILNKELDKKSVNKLINLLEDK